MNSRIHIRPMINTDVSLVFHALNHHNISKPLDYINRCWEQNKTGERTSLIALHEGQFAGWLHLLKTSYYPHFVENGIPEINNFDVVPTLRQLGIGSALMDAVEKFAFEEHRIVGIGVGLYESYGNAQRLYIKRGYIPDGRGVMYKEQPVIPGTEVCVDDDLVLYFTKERR
ncbi:GNAT family N-acetyltransferase [Paenibacillus luteus]|uniref:GNAT family N-acetyltransferase n=1 Tax=Paenibacillus luteus TaxID=2545753 RepID=UPI001F4FBFCB|nr:GNAT family N-acetyltransferase [Paenibacillus luteus]